MVNLNFSTEHDISIYLDPTGQVGWMYHLRKKTIKKINPYETPQTITKVKSLPLEEMTTIAYWLIAGWAVMESFFLVVRMMRVCTTCGENKPLQKFIKRTNGYSNQCKICLANREGDLKKWADSTYVKLKQYGTKDLY